MELPKIELFTVSTLAYFTFHLPAHHECRSRKYEDLHETLECSDGNDNGTICHLRYNDRKIIFFRRRHYLFRVWLPQCRYFVEYIFLIDWISMRERHRERVFASFSFELSKILLASFLLRDCVALNSVHSFFLRFTKWEDLCSRVLRFCTRFRSEFQDVDQCGSWWLLCTDRVDSRTSQL
jgi:hypothetical protein